MTGFLQIQAIEKRWDHNVTVGPISLDIARGEILALLGPSGSGKTTMLRLLAGFETADGGRIAVANEDATSLPPARRRFGMVFQHYALFPHLDVGQNIGFGLAGSRERGAVDAKVAAALALVDLTGYERRKVHELSGGQQQRVATVFVTHEQEEAFDLGDRIAVLNQGRLEQVGVPDELYEHPTNLFVATFVGRANVFRGKSARALGANGEGVLVVRPERLRFAQAGLPGIVRERRYIGAAAFFLVEADDHERFEVLAEPDAAKVGERVYVEATRVIAL